MSVVYNPTEVNQSYVWWQ